MIYKIFSNKGYKVTKDGKLLNPNGLEVGKTKLNKSTGINKIYYFCLHIRFEGKFKNLYVHRLQAY